MVVGSVKVGESQIGGGGGDSTTGARSFRILDPTDNSVDTSIFDVDPIGKSFNRFASGAVLRLFDDDGSKIDDYSYFDRVDVQQSTDGGASYSSYFSGLVVDRTRKSEEGPNELQLDVVGYDHLLRRDTVERSYNDSISNILNDVITRFTAVSWDASDVSVQNDATVNRDFKGERVDEVIGFLASVSADEEWGVNDDLEFFFQQQTTSRGDPVTDSDVIGHDLPNKGKRDVNSAQVYYGSSLDNVVTINDRVEQQSLKNNLNAPRRVVLRETDGYTEITAEDNAEAIARELEANRDVGQTGTVRLPLGRFDLEPGDVFSLTVSDAGVSGEDFRVAQVEQFWQRGETEVTIAENITGDIDDLLVNLSDQVVNARLRDVDTAATEVEHLDIQSGVTMSVTGTLTTKTAGSGFTLGQSQLGQGSSDELGGSVSSTGSKSIESVKVTRALLNMARDVWQGESNTSLTHLSAGTSDTAPSVSDNALVSRTGRESLSKFGAGNAAEAFEFVGRIPAGGVYGDASDIQELGIADASAGGNHYLRAVINDTGIDASTRLIAHFVVTIDTNSSEQGVVTSKGQERWRDLIIGETGHEASDFSYGKGTSSFSESDTSLNNQQHEDSINSTSDKEMGVCLLVERITSGDANTTDFAEVSTENSANEMLSALQFEALSSDKTLQTNWRFKAVNA